MSEQRGQVSVMGCGLLVLLVLAGFLIGILGSIDADGGSAQRAADVAVLAAAHQLADDPGASVSELREAAAASAAANGARLVSVARVDDGGLPSGVDVTVAVDAERGGEKTTVRAAARAQVEFAAAEPPGAFRPVDLHGLTGRSAVVAAAAAQVGWPYVWGGESRAEGGFDCSGLIDYAFGAAGAPLPGRPTAADLWHMSQPVPAAALLPGDLVFLGAPSGAPYHVGMYVSQGTVLSAPHTGAQVGYSPLAAGGWDGFGRLLPGGAVPVDDAVSAAARRAGVPGHVLAAELRLGLAADPVQAAAALARAQTAHPGSLIEALAAQLGSESAAALVARDGGGSGVALSGQVRLVPMPEPAQVQQASPAAPVRVRGTERGGPSDTGEPSGASRLETAVRAGEHAAEQLAERGRAVPLQAAAALRHLSRFGLTGLGAFLPDPDLRDAVNLAGSVWDGVSAGRDAIAAVSAGGAGLTEAGLWAARLGVIGGAISTGLFAAQAWTARRPRDRIGYGLMAAGSATATVGLATAGGSLVALGATTAVIPPVGLTLIAVGAGICVAGYLVRHPEWCRAALRVGSRALDLAWRVQTAPVRAASAVASTVADRARSIVRSIPTPW